MAFSFGFSGDDIDVDDTEFDHAEERNASTSGERHAELPELVPAQRHHIGDWLPLLPSQISYNTVAIKPQSGPEKQLTLARREVFDIRTQLMAEDTADHENEELISGLEQGDIKPNFYEGGFKTWECAFDLANVVVSESFWSPTSGESEDRHVIELGAGTAVPSLALFAQLLSQSSPTESGNEQKTQRRVTFTFADYNSAVLRLVTFPNLILTWNYIVSHENNPQASVDTSENQAEAEEEELDITPELIEGFQKDLSQRGIVIEFISGAWSPSFVDLTFSSVEDSYPKTLIMASETIYSPASLHAFSETLLELVRRSARGNNERTKALIAAKKVYFGVGGGVDEFLSVLKGVSGNELDVKEQVDVKAAVGRVVLSVGLGGSV